MAKQIKPMRGVKPTTELNFPFLASPKIDGVRALVKDGVVYSKTMKPLPNENIQKRFGHLHGADGEIVVGSAHKTSPDDDVFARSRGPIMRKTGDADFHFYIFDWWNMPDTHASLRCDYLLNLEALSVAPAEKVVHWLVKTQDELDEHLAFCLQQGYEGIMLRSTYGIYKYGQSTEKEGYLIKIKPMATREAVILGVVEQMANTNEATTDELGYTKRSTSKAGLVGKGTFGAFHVRCLESGAEFSVGNGPGLTHELRRQLWEQRDTLVGQYITYSYQEIGTQNAPRLPQFIRFRDATDISEVADD